MPSLSDSFAILIVLVIIVMVISSFFGKRDEAAGPRSDSTSLTRRQAAHPLVRQRQLHKKQAQGLDDESRNVVMKLDHIMDQELDYQPPTDRIAGLPEEYRQQVLNNLGPVIQKAIDTWIQNSNEMNTLIDERRLRLLAETAITRDLLAKLDAYAEARKLIIAKTKQIHEELTTIADDSVLWQQIVDEEINGLLTEVVGGFGSKLTQQQLRMMMLEDRRAQHQALKSEATRKTPADPESLETPKPHHTNFDNLDQLDDLFPDLNKSKRAPRPNGNGKEQHT